MKNNVKGCGLRLATFRFYEQKKDIMSMQIYKHDISKGKSTSTSSTLQGEVAGSQDSVSITQVIDLLSHYLHKDEDDIAQCVIRFLKEQKLEGGATFGNYFKGNDGTGAAINAEGDGEMMNLTIREALTVIAGVTAASVTAAEGNITSLTAHEVTAEDIEADSIETQTIDANTANIDHVRTDDVKTEGFTSGQVGGSGFGLYEENGKSVLEVDKLLVRMKAIFAQLEIRKISYVGGDFVFSAACGTIAQVTPIVENNQTIGYRCYLVADDGTTATTNDWRTGDQVKCKTFNVKSGVDDNVANRYYWRLVVARGQEVLSDGRLYSYIDLANTQSVTYTDEQGHTRTGAGYDTSVANDAPMAGDTIVLEGNQYDTDRQSMIELRVIGSDAPAFTEYANVNTFSLTNKEMSQLCPKTGDILKAKKFVFRTDLGDLPLTANAGVYSASKTYPAGVTVSYNGGTWISVADNNTGHTPNSNSQWWQPYAVAAQSPYIDPTSKNWICYDADGVAHDSGINAEGTSITVKGSFATSSELPSSGQKKGDAYIVGLNLWVFTSSTASGAVNGFQNVGQFRGADGKSPYIDANGKWHYYNASGTDVNSGLNAQGAQGESVTGSQVEYAVNRSVNSAPANASFSITLPQNLTEGDVLWTRTRTVISDGTYGSWVYTFSKVTVDGINSITHILTASETSIEVVNGKIDTGIGLITWNDFFYQDDYGFMYAEGNGNTDITISLTAIDGDTEVQDYDGYVIHAKQYNGTQPIGTEYTANGDVLTFSKSELSSAADHIEYWLTKGSMSGTVLALGTINMPHTYIDDAEEQVIFGAENRNVIITESKEDADSNIIPVSNAYTYLVARSLNNDLSDVVSAEIKEVSNIVLNPLTKVNGKWKVSVNSWIGKPKSGYADILMSYGKSKEVVRVTFYINYLGTLYTEMMADSWTQIAQKTITYLDANGQAVQSTLQSLISQNATNLAAQTKRLTDLGNELTTAGILLDGNNSTLDLIANKFNLRDADTEQNGNAVRGTDRIRTVNGKVELNFDNLKVTPQGVQASNGTFDNVNIGSSSTFSGKLTTIFKHITDSDATYDSGTGRYTLHNDLVLLTGANNIINLPTDRSYIGAHAILYDNGFPPYSRMSLDIYTTIKCNNPILMNQQHENYSNYSLKYQMIFKGGLVELIGVPYGSSCAWAVMANSAIYTNY